ncbi:MAG: hypothetical protein HYR72_08395 [Deltaproteobacteria bacterium]|nr:hypothetical protein [Deltaproteobacteria bacterium]MBI3388772.1 hypothetical protein [Deltaproteobacteria bacterium]
MRRGAWLVLVLVGAGLVAAGWAVRPRAWRANEGVNSDQVVREFAKIMSREVGAYHRALRPIAEDAEKDSGAIAAALTAIDARAAEAITKIQQHSKNARDQIDDMHELSLRTQDNRINRILAQARQAERSITQIATQARTDLQAHHH